MTTTMLDVLAEIAFEIQKDDAAKAKDREIARELADGSQRVLQFKRQRTKWYRRLEEFVDGRSMPKQPSVAWLRRAMQLIKSRISFEKDLVHANKMDTVRACLAIMLFDRGWAEDVNRPSLPPPMMVGADADDAALVDGGGSSSDDDVVIVSTVPPPIIMPWLMRRHHDDHLMHRGHDREHAIELLS